MKRDLYRELCEWKISERRKPLILRGARQTGKTHLLREFGANEYEGVAYFNFEEDPGLKDLFQGRLKPADLIEALGIYRQEAIKPGRDLIIFDEIQACNEALNALKYFQEQANEFHMAAAGSLLGVKLSQPMSFPVGKVNIFGPEADVVSRVFGCGWRVALPKSRGGKNGCRAICAALPRGSG